MRLLPREEKFFDYFHTQARLISEASLVLGEIARSGSASAAERITKLERDGDEIIHEIVQKLNATFITPLDPEDIHQMASRLDDVLDGIEEVGYKMFTYKATPLPAEAIKICDTIQASGQAIEKAFAALSQSKELMEHCIEINRLEDLADQIGRSAVAHLFEHEKDPIQIIKLKEIYDLLETACDACEDVADVLQHVVVKNS